ncbi:MAG TPA: SGNH/GDSL hydrolase family protein [Solirubrobacteraceae bacterium]|nr:SGNH/GDSL hydrolase family protein [Solirubrobacteraceae bacterium]
MKHSILRLCTLGAVGFALLAAPAVASAGIYTGLGDSYSAGSGAGVNDLSASCSRSTAGYPYQVAQTRTDLSLNYLACGGATTSDVVNSQVPYMSSSTSLVTITIGGNDVGFGNLVVACGSGSYAWCESQINTTNGEIANQLPGELDNAYSAIKSKAPGAQVLVLGYPHLFSSKGKTCSATGALSSTEETQLNGVADNLDSTIKTQAGKYAFTYKDAVTPFGGHDVCASSPWLWGDYNPYGAAYVFHPNATGQSSGYAAIVLGTIGY